MITKDANQAINLGNILVTAINCSVSVSPIYIQLIIKDQ